MAAPRRRRAPAPAAHSCAGVPGQHFALSARRHAPDWRALPVELGARCLALLADGEGLSAAMRCRLVCRAWAVWGEAMVKTCPALSLHWRTPERFSYSWCVGPPRGGSAACGRLFRAPRRGRGVAGTKTGSSQETVRPRSARALPKPPQGGRARREDPSPAGGAPRGARCAPMARAGRVRA